jgi:hypothetical protein
MIQNFADASRFHSGFRLLKRAIRHAMDPQAASILSASGSVIQYGSQVGLHLRHKVKASMKADVYSVEVSFTKSCIIACKCNCKAGSTERDKVVCVHILPVIYQVTLLLFDGLGEHTIIEWANYWNQNYENALDNECKHVLHSS